MGCRGRAPRERLAARGSDGAEGAAAREAKSRGPRPSAFPRGTRELRAKASGRGEPA